MGSLSVSQILEHNFLNTNDYLDRKWLAENGPIPTDVSAIWRAEDHIGSQLKRMIDASGEPAYDAALKLQMRSLMEETMGISPERAKTLVDSGYVGKVTNRPTEKPDALKAAANAFLSVQYGRERGNNFTKYLLTGDERFKAAADRYAEKERQYSVGTGDWGFLGNQLVNTARIGSSTLSSVVGGVAITGLTTLAGAIVGGPAGAAAGHGIGKALSSAFVLWDSGSSQAGSDLYELSLMTDENGRSLDLESPLAKTIFLVDLLANGAIEVVGMDFLPGYRKIIDSIGPSVARNAIKTTFRQSLKKYGKEVLEGVLAEGGEEFFQGWVSDLSNNLLISMNNSRKGTEFDTKQADAILKDSLNAFVETAKGMVTYGMITGGVGNGVRGARMRIESSRNQSGGEGVFTMDSSLLKTRQPEGDDDYNPEGKLPPVKVIQTKDGAVPASVEDNRVAHYLKGRKHARGVAVKPVDAAAASSFSRKVSDNLAYQLDLKVDQDGRYVAENEEQLAEAVSQVERTLGVISSRKEKDGGVAFNLLNENRESVQFSIGLAAPDSRLSPIEPDYGIMDTKLQRLLKPKDRYLDAEEHELVKNRVLESLEGNFSERDVEAGVNSIMIAARALQMPVDELLDRHMQIRFATSDDAEQVGNPGARGWLEKPATAPNGDVIHTIRLTRNADESTIVHETGHILRKLASPLQLEGFAKAYGGSVGAMWVEDIREQDGRYFLGDRRFDTYEEAFEQVRLNEERFADDFVAYVMEGVAPNDEMRGLFARMKEFLKNVYEQFSDRLSPETRKAFERLFSSQSRHSLEDSASGTLFQAGSEYEAVLARYKGSPLWMKAPNGKPTNLAEWQWVTARTPSFKDWFGDWEIREAVTRIADSEPKEIDVSRIPADADHRSVKARALEFGRTLTGDYTNKSDGFTFTLTSSSRFGSLKEILQHDYKDIHHLQSIAAIPYIAENSIFVQELENNNPRKPEIDRFRYYISAISIGDSEYLVKSIISVARDGGRYYDHKLTELSKIRKLISSSVNRRQTDSEISSLQIKDKRLLQIIQDAFNLHKVHKTTSRTNSPHPGPSGEWTGPDQGGRSAINAAEGYVFSGDPSAAAGTANASKGNGGTNGQRMHGRSTLESHLHEADAGRRTEGSTAGTAGLMPAQFLAEGRFGYPGPVDENGEPDQSVFSTFRRPLFQESSHDDEYRLTAEKYKDRPLWLRAPNGKPTNLTERQWVLVRTPSFKKWFGDWEKPARIQALKESKPIEITGDEIFSTSDLADSDLLALRRKAVEYGKKLRGKYLTSTEDEVSVTRNSIIELMQHDYKDIPHLQSIAAIPQLIANGIYIGTLANEKERESNIIGFDYYLAGLKIGGADYTVKFVISKSPDGKRYYDHKLTQIEKGELATLAPALSTTALQDADSPFPALKDKRLLSILQVDASKAVDENGEPKEFHHGTGRYGFDEFDTYGFGSWFGDDKQKISDFYTERNTDEQTQTVPGVYSVFLNVRNPLQIQKWFTGYDDGFVNAEEWVARINEDNNTSFKVDDLGMIPDEDGFIYLADAVSYNDAFHDAVMHRGFDGLRAMEGRMETWAIYRSSQAKSSTGNNGGFNPENGSLFFQDAVDARYFKALEQGDQDAARKIVDDQARRKGYVSGNDFRMNHKAPNSRDGFSVNLARIEETDLIPDGFWEHPHWYAGDTEMYSFWKVKEALGRLKQNGKAKIRLYRAIPKNIKEDMFRNGDWVTPDRSYAQGEGALIPGGYRIIVHQVPLEHVWWDVNSIAELGYDDGGDYAYRDTRNNRKLNDTVVRDEDGNIVPPSKRFNYRSDTLYQQAYEQEEGGHDGVVGNPSVRNEGQIVAFKPDQVRPAATEAGAYDHRNPSSLYQGGNAVEGKNASALAMQQASDEESGVYARNNTDAIAELRKHQGIDIANKHDGSVARFGERGRSKMLSNKARSKSARNGFSNEEHNTVVANVHRIFESAIRITERPDKKGGNKDVSISHYVTAIRFSGDSKNGYAKLLVKGTKNVGNRIYTVELTGLGKTESSRLDGELSEEERRALDSVVILPSGPAVVNAEPVGFPLFQLSDQKQKELLRNRKYEIQQLVSGHFYIKDELLEEFAGEDWADEEIRFRKVLREFPWVLDAAKKFDDVEDYLESLKNDPMYETAEYEWHEEDEEWFRRIFDYSRIPTPDDLDRQFVRQYTMDPVMLVRLAQKMKSYEDLGVPIQHRTHKQPTFIRRFGAFKGVSTRFLRLHADSGMSEISKVAQMIQADPRPYRKALQVVEQAESRVMEARGLASREDISYDYYSALGEDLEEDLGKLQQEAEEQARQKRLEAIPEHLQGLPESSIADSQKQSESILKNLGEAGSTTQELSKRLETSNEISRALASRLDAAESDLRQSRQAYASLRSELRKEEEKLGRREARISSLLEKLADARRHAQDLGKELDGSRRKLERQQEWTAFFKELAVVRGRRIASKEAEIRSLVSSLRDRREMVWRLRGELTEANRENRRLASALQAARNRDETRRFRQAFRDVQARILRNSRFNGDTMDAMFEEAMNYVHNLFNKDVVSYPGKIPALLIEYMPEWFQGYDTMPRGDNRMASWNIDELLAIDAAARLMVTDARVKKVARDGEIQARRQQIALQHFRQIYSRMPKLQVNSRKSVNMMADIAEDVNTTKQKYHNGQEGNFTKTWHGVTMAFAHIQRIARLVDGNMEGAMYGLFVRDLWDGYNTEHREIQRRLSALEEKRKALGITDQYLAQELVTYKAGGATDVSLTREEAIGVYIYSRNKMAMEKLLSHGGNGMSVFDLSDIVEKLDKKDIEFGDYLIDSIGGDAEYARLKEAVYRIYNINLGREEHYFPLRAKGLEVEGSADLLSGPTRASISYIDKGMTVDRVHAKYQVDLAVLNTWQDVMRQQEHLMALGQWVKDANYLLGPNGAVGHTINTNFGSTIRQALQDHVNRVAGQKDNARYVSKIFNTLLSKASASMISYNVSSMMKQMASLSAVLRGGVSPVRFFQMMLSPVGPHPQFKNWRAARDAMYELAPDMKSRTFNVEVQRFRNLKNTTQAGRTLKKVTDFGLEHGTGAVDSMVVTRLWWAAYMTALDKHLDGREAVFRASQFIAESQSTTNQMDMSLIQQSENSFFRIISQFRNDAFQHWNQIFFDLPYHLRNQMWIRAAGDLASVLVGGALITLATGAFLGNGGDDEKWWVRFLKALFPNLLGEFIPFAGEAVAAGFNGYSSGGVLSLGSDIGNFIREATDGDGDSEALGNRIWDMIAGLGTAAGVPSVMPNRILRTLAEENPWRLMGGYWYRMWEDAQ